MSGEVATGTLRRTPLYQEHIGLGARMVPFAGWEMPLQYSGIVEEHQAVRRRAGMFDVSHMGRFEVMGPQAPQMLRRLCTYNVGRLSPGQGHYTLLCNENGGILDDQYVFILSHQRFLLVANAANAHSASTSGCSSIDRHTRQRSWTGAARRP